MKKRRLRFFLDYGTCFWGANYDDGFYGGLMPEDLPLNATTVHEINLFLKEYHQSYDLGCPPSAGWTINDCKKFNREYKRIFDLVMPELKDQFIVCNEQVELIEEEELLDDFYVRGREFMQERSINVYNWSDDL